jgi:hypothetical protein
MGKNKLLLPAITGLLLLMVLVVVALPSMAQGGGLLPLNQPVNGTLFADQNRQEWTFTAEPTTTVTLSVTRTAGVAPLSLQMFNSTGTILVNITTDASGTATIPTLYLEGGAYRVVLTGDFTLDQTPATYTISISAFNAITVPSQPDPDSIALPTPTDEPQSPAIQLEIGERYEGTLTNGDDVVRFAFLGRAEEYVTFGMNAPEDSLLDPAVELRAPDGSIIAASDDYYDTTTALVIHEQLPTTGVYELIASSQNNEPGDYMVAIGRDFVLYDVERGVGAHNQPIIARIENMGVRDVWFIDVEAGELLTVSVENWGSDFIDPMVEIVTPGGETLAFNDDGGEDRNAFITGIQAPETGRYRVHVAVYDHGSAGAYRLLWRADSRTPTPTAPRPSPTSAPIGTQPPTATPTVATTDDLSATVLSLVEQRGSMDGVTTSDAPFERTITLAEDDKLDLVIEGYFGFDGILELYDANGVLITSVDDVGFAETYDINPRLTYIADEDGEYLIRIYGFNTNTGEFRLSWRVE